MQLPQLPDTVYEKIIKVLITVLIGLVLILITKKSLNAFFDGIQQRSTLSSYKKRIGTFCSLFENIAVSIIVVLIGLIIAKDLGFDITPILTGAGILGLAISFGSQTLVKDIIAGFFIISENQYNVGDTILLDKDEGIVEKINLRTTVLRDKKNNTIYIPNSEIKRVTVIKSKSSSRE
ncbi:MAG TPA: mechanosensitive ion channel domain-containing protein [Candidatus Nitrosocosmicus sp.]|nr:mechanosensitive ion channel domain-containing protein [Candidatus Nitrosocosmicus sp.]